MPSTPFGLHHDSRVVACGVPGGLDRRGLMAPVSVTLNYTGGAQTFVVPRHVPGTLKAYLRGGNGRRTTPGTTADGVVTGLDIYLNTGQPVAGTRLRVWGRRRAS